ncbi:MAG TPA: cysteine--tRNA ligase, partial [Candidatus Altiarchaeales archaeon]|nr:cysteine--tRNA ligase [Candidatus Altiarchaeales archaeon]
MVLRIYNTLTRRKDVFAPLKKNVVGMYVCGITPYDMMHIGHARTYIAFDVIYRYLLYKGYRVRYIQNITDIDDKIIKRAKELDIEPFELSNMFAKYAIDDQKKLGIKRPAAYPRVSENIDEIIGFIEG